MKADVIVIGGGASGLAAAVACAREGVRVLILEQMSRIGKKLLATGNGRCNYTNEYMAANCFHSQHLDMAAKMVSKFQTRDALDFFQELGIVPKSVNGYIYPNSLQAASILDCLRFELERLKVTIETDKPVTKIRPKGKGYQVYSKEEVFHCRRVIIACGGKASPKLGSKGDGYMFAKDLGQKVYPVVPALTGLKAAESVYKSLAGVRTEACVTLWVDGQRVDSHRGEVQLAEYGISGIPVFQLSGQAAYGLRANKHVFCELDFFPDISLEELEGILLKRQKQFEGRPAEVFETGLLNRKLIQACMKTAKKRKTDLWPDMQALAGLLKAFPATIKESRGYDFAQVCAGGVLLTEIDPKTCESYYHKGCYFVGELLDVDGICGGYNLHWAWLTGILAGSHAGRECYDSNRTD